LSDAVDLRQNFRFVRTVAIEASSHRWESYIDRLQPVRISICERRLQAATPADDMRTTLPIRRG